MLPRPRPLAWALLDRPFGAQSKRRPQYQVMMPSGEERTNSAGEQILTACWPRRGLKRAARTSVPRPRDLRRFPNSH